MTMRVARLHWLDSGTGVGRDLGGRDLGGRTIASTCRQRRTRSRGVTGRSEQVKERANPKPFLGTVPEPAVRVDGVDVAAAVTVAGQVTRSLQVGHDGLDGALGEAHNGADVTHPRLRIAGDLHQ